MEVDTYVYPSFIGKWVITFYTYLVVVPVVDSEETWGDTVPLHSFEKKTNTYENVVGSNFYKDDISRSQGRTDTKEPYLYPLYRYITEGFRTLFILKGPQGPTPIN